MKQLGKTTLTIGAIMALLSLQELALSAEQSDAKGGSTSIKSARTLAQTIEEIRNSINEGWQKLTNPKTVEPARNKVNEVYKELSDAAAASGSSDKSKKETRDKKEK